MTSARIRQLEDEIAPLRARLLAHSVYDRIQDLASVQQFMRVHVFAVWDFMTWLKTLQRAVTCVELPWQPPAAPDVARFINRLVLDEESDEILPGVVLSHFELYLLAMEDLGAAHPELDAFLARVRASGSIEASARDIESDPLRQFLTENARIASGPIHGVASAFLYGREDVIPDMFQRVLDQSRDVAPERTRHFRLYLERHIDLDGGDHSDCARQLLVSLCGDSDDRWIEAELTASRAIEARLALWDDVVSRLEAAVPS
ncbi:MAG: DUF3050 domain-containing protein [Planctomycetota bacterium]